MHADALLGTAISRGKESRRTSAAGRPGVVTRCNAETSALALLANACAAGVGKAEHVRHSNRTAEAVPLPKNTRRAGDGASSVSTTLRRVARLIRGSVAGRGFCCTSLFGRS